MSHQILTLDYQVARRLCLHNHHASCDYISTYFLYLFLYLCICSSFQVEFLARWLYQSDFGVAGSLYSRTMLYFLSGICSIKFLYATLPCRKFIRQWENYLSKTVPYLYFLCSFMLINYRNGIYMNLMIIRTIRRILTRVTARFFSYRNF